MSSVIITGASRGIGFATTKEFLEQGWNVVACSRNLSSLRDLRLKYGARLQLVKLDLSNKESIHHSASQILDANQSIDVLIHNAGYLVNKPFSKITADELEAAYWVNALGPFLLTQQLLPALKERAHVLAISSMGGFQGSIKFPGLTAYSSSKAAIASLMECLARRIQRFSTSLQLFMHWSGADRNARRGVSGLSSSRKTTANGGVHLPICYAIRQSYAWKGDTGFHVKSLNNNRLYM
jgi:3-oxoacyl-[acyl-carrier protein] reductase